MKIFVSFSCKSLLLEISIWEAAQRCDCLLEGKRFWKENKIYTQNYPFSSTQAIVKDILFLKNKNCITYIKTYLYEGCRNWC